MLRRNVLVGGVLIAIAGIALWMWSGNAYAPETPYSLDVATTTPAAAESETTTAQSALVRADTAIVLKSAPVEEGTATLSVDGVRYSLTAPEGTTLKEAMDRLQTESGFVYEYRNYAGLGAFVTTINGRASTGDMVWILYVRGEKSSTGISSTRIRSGDVIEWKLEKSY